MTITAADIKIGMCIEMDGKTYLVVDFQHCKPGKGPAFVRSKLKNLENGRVIENTFSSVGQKIEQVRVERRPYQFTYEDDMGAHFMHTETFEEIIIDKNLINNYDLMADGQIVEVMFHTDKEIARYGKYRRHHQGAPLHQHGRQDPRRHPYARVLRAHTLVLESVRNTHRAGSKADIHTRQTEICRVILFCGQPQRQSPA